MATPNRLPEFVDGYTYASALNEALRNDGQPARYSGSELDAFKNQTMPGCLSKRGLGRRGIKRRYLR